MKNKFKKITLKIILSLIYITGALCQNKQTTLFHLLVEGIIITLDDVSPLLHLPIYNWCTMSPQAVNS